VCKNECNDKHSIRTVRNSACVIEVFVLGLTNFDSIQNGHCCCRVLHPIFEEDELTLILAGGGLGFLAGFIQQLFSTGAMTFPSFSFGTPRLVQSLGSLVSVFVLSVALKPEKNLLSFMQRLMERTRQLKKRTRRLVRRQKSPTPEV
jgi:hypothetical protein